jgi:type III secretory pathway component EscT
MHPSLLQLLGRLFAREGIDLASWGMAFARVFPVLVIVPAFGLRALSVPVRAAAAFVLAAVIVPAIQPVAAVPISWASLLLLEVARGTLVAIAAAIPLWSATMAGGIVDALRGSQDQTDIPTVEGRSSPLGALFSLLAAAIFLATGGPARVVGILLAPVTGAESAVARAAANLASGIGLATAVAAPLIAASLVVEVAGALIARAASPAQLSALLAPLRSLALLALTAILLDRMAAFIANWPGS